MLAGEPFHLSLDEIKKLTAYQVNAIYCHERTKDGQLVIERTGGAEPVSYRELFFRVWRGRGLPDWRIEERWVGRQQQQAEEQEPKRRRRK